MYINMTRGELGVTKKKFKKSCNIKKEQKHTHKTQTNKTNVRKTGKKTNISGDRIKVSLALTNIFYCSLYS